MIPYITAIGLLLFFTFFITLVILGIRDNQNYWKQFNSLKERAYSCEAKEEISDVYEELVSLGEECNNPYIRSEIKTVLAYLKGLYKGQKQ